MAYFGDRKVGEMFEIHSGGDSWILGTKVGLDSFRKGNGVVISVSQWTKTRDKK